MKKSTVVTLVIVLATGAARANADTPPDLPGSPASELPPPPTPEPGAGSGTTSTSYSTRTDLPDRPVSVPVRAEDQYVDLTPIDDPAPELHRAAPANLAPGAEPPLSIAASAFAAGYGYSSHPTRAGGFESQIRGDVWRGLGWGAHVGYTADVIEADDNMPTATTKSAEGFHDINIGGSMALRAPIPAWAFAEGHILAGSTSYGTGVAIFGGAGARLFAAQRYAFDVELGAGAVWTGDDSGPTVSLRVAKTKIQPWLDLAAMMLYTNDSPSNALASSGGSKLAGGGAVTLGPWNKFSVVVDGLFGSRVFSMISRGQIVENVPDVYHTTVRLFLWYALTDRLRLYVGGSYRTATAEVTHDYTLVSGFAGAVVGF